MLATSDVLSGTQQAMTVIYPLCSHKSGSKHAPGNRVPSAHFKLYHYLVQPPSLYNNLLSQVIHIKKCFEYGIFRILQPPWASSTFDAISMNVMYLHEDDFTRWLNERTVQWKSIWGKAGDFKWCFHHLNQKTVFRISPILTYWGVHSSSSKQQPKFQLY